MFDYVYILQIFCLYVNDPGLLKPPTGQQSGGFLGRLSGPGAGLFLITSIQGVGCGILFLNWGKTPAEWQELGQGALLLAR
jgi:hypothetical protein